MPLVTTTHTASFEDYASFFEAHGGCVFISPAWLTQVTDGSSLQFCSFFLDEKLVGMLPYKLVRGRLLSGVQQLPLTPYTDICWNNQVGRTEGLLAACLDNFRKDLLQLKLDYITLCFHPRFKLSDRNSFSYILDLKQPEEALFKGMRTDKQRNIKKALKTNASVQTEKHADLIYELVQKTFERQQGDTDWMQYLHRIVNHTPTSFQVTVYTEDTPGCSLFFIYDTERCYYLLGGIDPALNNYNLGPYAMWKGILHARSLGLSIFDFEGSSIPSIEQYFKSFGATKEYFSSFNHFNWRYKTLKWLRII